MDLGLTGERENEEDSNLNSSFNSNDRNYSKNVCHNDFNFVLANARSLKPKIISLVDTLEEISGHIAVVTETWLKPTPQTESLLTDAENLTGYGFLRKDRCENNSEARGGGVAIVYKKADLQMTKLKVVGNHEIVAGLARRTGQKRKIVTIGAYIPPSADAEESKSCLLYTSPSPRDRQKSRMPSSA